jgi:uncharacterized protein (TIGR03083 family)
MSAPGPWPVIHSERHALAADLQQLTPEQWDTPSLCAGRSVRDVLAHMTATAEMTPPKFLAKLAKSGFKFGAMTDADIAQRTSGTPAEGLAAFESQADTSTHPPGPADSWLGETIIHAEDIRRPLGIAHEYPTDAVLRVADFYKKSNLLIGAKNRITGLTLRATDADWATGTGPEVRGPALALVLAMTGRPAGLDGLSGDGVGMLQSRMPEGAIWSAG